MTVPVTAISGLAGLLSPGMRVDVLLTIGAGCLEKPAPARRCRIRRRPASPPGTSCVESDLTALPWRDAAGAPPAMTRKRLPPCCCRTLVLATGRLAHRDAAARRAAGEQNMYNNVTLMLTRKDAQMLTLCLTQGQINLLLRKAGESKVAWRRFPAKICRISWGSNILFKI